MWVLSTRCRGRVGSAAADAWAALPPPGRLCPAPPSPHRAAQPHHNNRPRRITPCDHHDRRRGRDGGVRPASPFRPRSVSAPFDQATRLQTPPPVLRRVAQPRTSKAIAHAGSRCVGETRRGGCRDGGRLGAIVVALLFWVGAPLSCAVEIYVCGNTFVRYVNCNVYFGEDDDH